MNFETHDLVLITASDTSLGLLIGIRPGVAPDGIPAPDLVFFDLSHERRFPIIKPLVDEVDLLRFKTFEDVEITVRPLTLGLYNERVKSKLTDPPEFKTEAALREHFLVTIFGSPTSPA